MNVLRAVVALSMVFVLVAVVGAADEKKAKKGGVQGVVEKVDAEGKSLTLKAGKKKDQNAASVTIAFNDQTKFAVATNDGEKEAKLADVAVGKRVMVQKATKDGKEVASKVTIVERKGK